MKKRITLIVLSVIFIACAIPVQASAVFGGYIAWTGDRLYHCGMGCDELAGVNTSQLIWFDTLNQVKAAGRTPCEYCAIDYDWDYEPEELGKYTFWMPNTPLMEAILEIEQEYGYLTGEQYAREDINEEWIYENAYDEGYRAGYSDGERSFESTLGSSYYVKESKSEVKTSQSTKIEEEESSDSTWFVIMAAAVISSLATWIWHETRNSHLYEQERKKRSNDTLFFYSLPDEQREYLQTLRAEFDKKHGR